MIRESTTSSFVRLGRHALTLASAALVGAASAGAATIAVPGDQPTIQGAIAAASNGDEIVVAAGTYREWLDFSGKDVVLRSASGAAVTFLEPPLARRPVVSRAFVEEVDPQGRVTYLDSRTGSADLEIAGSNPAIVNFASGETRAAVLTGFTIRNGDAGNWGGGARTSLSSPTIRGNVFVDNMACGGGGGLVVQSGSPLIEGNLFANNHQSGCSGGPGGGAILVLSIGNAEIVGNEFVGNSWSSGGAISLFGNEPALVKDNLFRQNSARFGGAIRQTSSSGRSFITQNVFRENEATDDGAAISYLTPSGVVGVAILNNTMVGNLGAASLLAAGFHDERIENNIIVPAAGEMGVECDTRWLAPSFSHNDVLGSPAYGGDCVDPTGSDGNLSVAPGFVSQGGGNFRLAADSALIDAGDGSATDLPDADFDGNPRVLDGDGDLVATVDMGAFEADGEPPCADADGDGYGAPASALCDEPLEDCDDSDPAVNPGATELCNGVDDDCAGGIDDAFPLLDTSCSAGVGVCEADGTVVCSADGLGTECDATPGEPGVEGPHGDPTCGNALDDDCDGATDELDGDCALLCTDGDGDGYAIDGGECGAVDCNDADPAVNPGAAEIPGNGVDDDCDPSTPTGCNAEQAFAEPGA